MPIPAETGFDAQEFDEWAETYDAETGQAAGFPFEGYPQVLDAVLQCAGGTPGSVLDVGTGTGALALRFLAQGWRVWAADFSTAMLGLARRKAHGLPGEISFVQWDVRAPFPPELPAVFNSIVSAYTLHHFPLDGKIALLNRLRERLVPGGRVAIGDLGFENQSGLSLARLRYGAAWDEEPYWVASETLPALVEAGWQVWYRQISGCAGVYCLSPLD